MTSPFTSLSRIASKSLLAGSRRGLSSTPLLLVTRKADPRAWPRLPYDPKLAHHPVTESQLGGHGDESNPHNIPPEGDQDHGRSGWGFQSRSRHEHFTFPGEEPHEYWPDQGIKVFWTPGWRHFWFWLAAYAIIYPRLPARPPLNVPRGDDITLRRTDSIAKQGPDDDRVLLMRWFEWYMSPAEDWRKTYWDRFAADYARISRNRAFYMTLADDKQMNRNVQPLSMDHQLIDAVYLPGTIVPPLSDEQMINNRDLALSVGVDTEFYKAQPPNIW